MHLAFPTHFNLFDLDALSYLVEYKLQTFSFYFFSSLLLISFPIATHIFLSVRDQVSLSHTTSYKAGVLCTYKKNVLRQVMG